MMMLHLGNWDQISDFFNKVVNARIKRAILIASMMMWAVIPGLSDNRKMWMMWSKDRERNAARRFFEYIAYHNPKTINN